MLDILYDTIGRKIKVLAQGIFIIETIGAVITGIVLLANEFFAAGLITLFCGPVVALISTWLLYAFGQLVDDTHTVRMQNIAIENINQNLQTLAQPMIDESKEKAKREAEDRAKLAAEIKAKREAEANAKRETIEKAKTSFIHNNPNAPYWCGKCGFDGPYEGNCPKCNSSMRIYNT